MKENKIKSFGSKFITLYLLFKVGINLEVVNASSEYEVSRHENESVLKKEISYKIVIPVFFIAVFFGGYFYLRGRRKINIQKIVDFSNKLDNFEFIAKLKEDIEQHPLENSADYKSLVERLNKETGIVGIYNYLLGFNYFQIYDAIYKYCEKKHPQDSLKAYDLLTNTINNLSTFIDFYLISKDNPEKKEIVISYNYNKKLLLDINPAIRYDDVEYLGTFILGPSFRFQPKNSLRNRIVGLKVDNIVKIMRACSDNKPELSNKRKILKNNELFHYYYVYASKL